MFEMQAVIEALSNFGIIGLLIVAIRYVDGLRLSERERADRYERRILRILAGDFIDKIDPLDSND